MDVVITTSSNLDLVNHISPNSPDTLHSFSSCSLLSPSLLCRNKSSIDYHDMYEGLLPWTFIGRDSSLRPL